MRMPSIALKRSAYGRRHNVLVVRVKLSQVNLCKVLSVAALESLATRNLIKDLSGRTHVLSTLAQLAQTPLAFVIQLADGHAVEVIVQGAREREFSRRCVSIFDAEPQTFWVFQL